MRCPSRSTRSSRPSERMRSFKNGFSTPSPAQRKRRRGERSRSRAAASSSTRCPFTGQRLPMTATNTSPGSTGRGSPGWAASASKRGRSRPLRTTTTLAGWQPSSAMQTSRTASALAQTRSAFRAANASSRRCATPNPGRRCPRSTRLTMMRAPESRAAARPSTLMAKSLACTRSIFRSRIVIARRATASAAEGCASPRTGTTMGSMPSARTGARNLPYSSLQARNGSNPRGWRRNRSTSCRSVPPTSKRLSRCRTRGMPYFTASMVKFQPRASGTALASGPSHLRS